ncbi:MAG: hypothetical protein K9G76_03815 [Bacteroidales bacterium]|nr:hypothetical protein [Bacteroidales bacterium]MCF8402922.1 hypothetical protein [Bacteroidales bacterium]
MASRNYKEESLIESYIKGPTLGYSDNFPNRNMWLELSKELNAEFKIKRNSGQELETHILRVPYKNWKLIFSVSDSRPWKCQAEFKISQDFNMTLSWEGFVERFLKRFRKPEIEVGWKKFDNHYLIESDRADLVKKVLNEKVQKTLLKHNIYSISYQTNIEYRTSSFVSVISRNVGEKEKIIELLEMYKEFIDKLFENRIIK